MPNSARRNISKNVRDDGRGGGERARAAGRRGLQRVRDGAAEGVRSALCLRAKAFRANKVPRDSREELSLLLHRLDRRRLGVGERRRRLSGVAAKVCPPSSSDGVIGVDNIGAEMPIGLSVGRGGAAEHGSLKQPFIGKVAGINLRVPHRVAPHRANILPRGTVRRGAGGGRRVRFVRLRGGEGQPDEAADGARNVADRRRAQVRKEEPPEELLEGRGARCGAVERRR